MLGFYLFHKVEVYIPMFRGGRARHKRRRTYLLFFFFWMKFVNCKQTHFDYYFCLEIIIKMCLWNYYKEFSKYFCAKISIVKKKRFQNIRGHRFLDISNSFTGKRYLKIKIGRKCSTLIKIMHAASLSFISVSDRWVPDITKKWRKGYDWNEFSD